MILKSELQKGEVLATPLAERGPFAFTVETAEHSLVADEPQEKGGEDGGMNPFDLLAASLATCTAMTLRFYTKRKNLDLGPFQVRVSSQSSLDPETQESIYVLTRHLIFEDIQDPELISKFKEISEKCPVHKTLQGKIHILTHVSKGEKALDKV